MSVTRISSDAGVVELKVVLRNSPRQRLTGLCSAGCALGTSALQAAASLATLPMLPFGAPVWLGLHSAANLRRGLAHLYHAASGVPSHPVAVDEAYLAALCLDVQHAFAGADRRPGTAAAAQLLSMPEVDLGAWLAEVQETFARGVGAVAQDAIMAAAHQDDPDAACVILETALLWLQNLPALTHRDSAWAFGHRALHLALRTERWWMGARSQFDAAMQALEGGALAHAENELRALLQTVPPHASEDRRAVAVTGMLHVVREQRLRALAEHLERATGLGDWVAARTHARALVVYGKEALQDAAVVRRAQEVLEHAVALLGEQPLDFDAVLDAARALGVANEWRVQQIEEARVLLGPGTTSAFETLADEIIATQKSDASFLTPRIMHALLPRLFYHPEANQHGPYIKMVPQMILAAFACARRRDGDDPRLHHQRCFFAEAFVDRCFEGRADAMMTYLVDHPLDDAPAVDMEVILDTTADMSDKARACEHFRVYNAVQVRRYAMARGIDFRSDDWPRVRPALEGNPEYERDYCNSTRFAAYLLAQDFLRDAPDKCLRVEALIAYLTHDVGIFSSETNA